MNQLYMHHHRQWWCHRQMFFHFKHIYTILNILSLLVTSLGLIIGPVLQNVLLTSVLAAIGMFIKGWNDFKRYSIKMDMRYVNVSPGKRKKIKTMYKMQRV